MAAPRKTHGALLDLRAEIEIDSTFKELCLSYGRLREDVVNEPRGDQGPTPEYVQAL